MYEGPLGCTLPAVLTTPSIISGEGLKGTVVRDVFSLMLILPRIFINDPKNVGVDLLHICRERARFSSIVV